MRKRRVAGIRYGMKYSGKGLKDRNRHKNRIKRRGQARPVDVKGMNGNIPTTRSRSGHGRVQIALIEGVSKMLHQIWKLF